MKITQLSEESGFSRSTIRHYLLEGLLHLPVKTGKTVAYYDENHLEKLKLIRQLKEEKELSLSEIKEILKERYITTASETSYHDKREQIINKAITNFIRNGFIGTTINDITKSVGLKKSTFYSYFKSKKEFFIICVNHLARSDLNKISLKNIRNAEDFDKNQRMRTAYYLKTQNKYNGILNNLKTFLRSDDPKQAQLARDALRAFIEPIILDNRQLIDKGMIRKVDEVLLAYAIFGVLDGISHALILNPGYTVEEGVNFIIDIFSTALSSNNTGVISKYPSTQLYFDVTDSGGVSIRLSDVTFGNKQYFTGSHGHGEIRIHPENVSSLRFKKTGPVVSVSVIIQGGKPLTLKVDGTLQLSGQSAYGEFMLPLENISQIVPIKDKLRF